ncbi:hypothetical protein AcW1_001497 [Taiwanofungus camphoratus]|nr:hypothetical protein AcV7_003653 [Antrodia cinnamomea]KAI0945229.1 hypothetical protein AcW1_001497 [Antrodia cinnamomea]
MAPKEEPREAVLPPAPAPSAPNKPPAKSAANTKGRDDALKTIATARRATAWQIHRWPLEKRIVHERTRVHLPRTYLGTDGEDVRAVHAGADLNQFVHRHYLAPVERAQLGRTNFVTADTVVARRRVLLRSRSRSLLVRSDARCEPRRSGVVSMQARVSGPRPACCGVLP